MKWGARIVGFVFVAMWLETAIMFWGEQTFYFEFYPLLLYLGHLFFNGLIYGIPAVILFYYGFKKENIY